MKKYNKYSSKDVDIMLTEPWEISDNPYMLHAAYALSTLYDICADQDDEEVPDIFNIFGKRISKKILDRMVIDIADDFNDASDNRKTIKIFDKSYSIRKVNAYDNKRLTQIFDFQLEDDEYIISKEGIIDLSGASANENTYKKSCDELQINKLYLRQIIKLAEDDKNNGWDKLTDMEIILYCWARFYTQRQMENIILFKEEYKDYIYVKEADIESCFTERATLRQRPVGLYTFSYSKVKEWNKKNKQRSFAENIDKEEADNYWYDIALKDTFTPIDMR